MYTTLKEVLKEAEDLNMAIGAFNTHNLEMLPSIIKAASRNPLRNVANLPMAPRN